MRLRLLQDAKVIPPSDLNKFVAKCVIKGMAVLGSSLTVQSTQHTFLCTEPDKSGSEPVTSSMLLKAYKCLAPIALASQTGVGPTYHSPTPIVMY